MSTIIIITPPPRSVEEVAASGIVESASPEIYKSTNYEQARELINQAEQAGARIRVYGDND